MNWFEKLVGFQEDTPDQVRQNLVVEGNQIQSLVNGRRFQHGRLEIASLESLRTQANAVQLSAGALQVSEVVGNVQHLHQDPAHQNALFQAASQFNLLEMTGPTITPEMGISRYAYDRTQGPACAIACGAGTIYRNYLVPIQDQIGQTAEIQIDGLEDIGAALGNTDQQYWVMRNGYALLPQEGLLKVNKTLHLLTPAEREKLKSKLKIGLQWETEVTIGESKKLVSQAYCSALPVAYTRIDPMYWEPFARLILEATYEATFHAAILNFAQTGVNKLFLTLVGGGAFGNEMHWILESITQTIEKFRETPLDVRIVSYGGSDRRLKPLFT